MGILRPSEGWDRTVKQTSVEFPITPTIIPNCETLMSANGCTWHCFQSFNENVGRSGIHCVVPAPNSKLQTDSLCINQT
jgi:hypothetical protein